MMFKEMRRVAALEHDNEEVVDRVKGVYRHTDVDDPALPSIDNDPEEEDGQGKLEEDRRANISGHFEYNVL